MPTIVWNGRPRSVECASPKSARLVEALIQRARTPVTVGICARTENGPAFAGMIIQRPTAPRRPGWTGGDPLVRGFRPNRVPLAVVTERILSSPMLRLPMERADAAWVHGRDMDDRAAALREMHVAVVGCGSLGAPVAVALAQAGLGHLTLVDPDYLSWANVGRHVLGADDVGKLKAFRLSRKIRSDLPHMRAVDVEPYRIQRLLSEKPEVLDNCDLIIAATGDWAAESFLNDWHVGGGRPVPILYTWTEEHALAGHAVAICAEGGCLRCGFDALGRPLRRITSWPEGERDRQEPACGAVFQPYGPIEMSHVVTLASEAALDCLLTRPRSSSHRMFLGRRSRLEALGGSLTAFGRGLVKDTSLGSCEVDRGWPGGCSICEFGSRSLISYPIGSSGQSLIFTQRVLDHFLTNRQMRWYEREAGGQLFARFDGKEIIISEATGPRRSDRRGRHSYEPDRVAEQEEIDAIHRAGLHFVGDWHSHPEDVPAPSPRDRDSITRCFAEFDPPPERLRPRHRWAGGYARGSIRLHRNAHRNDSIEPVRR